MNLMKMILRDSRILALLSGFGLSLALTLDGTAAVLVYDGIPVSGSGCYNAVNNPKLTDQNPTHTSILGETGKWLGDTGTIMVTNGGLGYASGIFLSTQGGSVLMQSASTSGGPRSVKRVASPALAGKSFYFGALLSYNDLSANPADAYAVWGLTKTASSVTAYPAADGVLVGFQRTATGVDAVLRVLGASYTIQSNITPGTYHFVGRFVYNADGNETVYASVNPGRDEPSSWTTNAVAEVLTSGQSLAYVNVGYNYTMNGKYVLIDEWRVGDSYVDVLGSSQSAPFVTTLPATNATATSGWMNGLLATTGTATTVVSVYYGDSDCDTNAALWKACYIFPEAATSQPQSYTREVTGLAPYERQYYRYAASNAVGFVWGDTINFLPQPSGLPTVSNAAVSSITTTTATLTGNISTASPPATVYACWDTVDKGTSSTGAWSKVSLVGTFAEPSAVSKPLTGLVANNHYYCRFYAVNALGAVWGTTVVEFQTVKPAVSITDAYANEGDDGLSQITLAVKLDAVSASNTVVAFATRDGGSLAGADYVALSGTLTLPAGTTSASLTFDIIGDDREEFPGNAFWVDLNDPVGATLGTATAQAGILDDDMGHRLFYDDFNDGNSTGWTFVTDTDKWSVVSKTLKHAASANSGTAQAGDPAWTDYGFRAMMRTTAEWKYLGMRVRQSAGSALSGYVFTFERTEGNGAYAASLKAGDVTLGNISGYVSNTRVGTTSLRPVAMRVRPTKSGETRIQCYIDLTLVFDKIDAANTYTAGLIGLYGGSWSESYYDNVEVFAEPPPLPTVILVK